MTCAVFYSFAISYTFGNAWQFLAWLFLTLFDSHFCDNLRSHFDQILLLSKSIYQDRFDLSSFLNYTKETHKHAQTWKYISGKKHLDLETYSHKYLSLMHCFFYLFGSIFYILFWWINCTKVAQFVFSSHYYLKHHCGQTKSRLSVIQLHIFRKCISLAITK